MELLQDFYETTLDALKDAKNDRLWFKTNTKLGKLYYDRSDFNRLAKILKQLHQSCQVHPIPSNTSSTDVMLWAFSHELMIILLPYVCFDLFPD